MNNLKLFRYYLDKMIKCVNIEIAANKCATNLLDYLRINSSFLSGDDYIYLTNLIKESFDVIEETNQEFNRYNKLTDNWKW